MVSNENLVPASLIIPTGSILQGTTFKGNICISGAKLVFFNGSAWELVTSA